MAQPPPPPPQPPSPDPWRKFLPLIIGVVAALAVLFILGIVVANTY